MKFPTGDRGQRYEVSYAKPHAPAVRAHGEPHAPAVRAHGERKVFGWSETIEGAEAFSRSIDLHPSMTAPQIRDRRT